MTNNPNDESLIEDFPEPPEEKDEDEYANDDAEYDEELSDGWDRMDNLF